MRPAIEYMNELCSWTIEEGVPPYDERWTKRLAAASDMLAAKDRELAALRAAVAQAREAIDLALNWGPKTQSDEYLIETRLTEALDALSKLEGG